MANLSLILKDVLPYLSADPSQPVTMAALRRAAYDLCNDAWLWRTDAQPVGVTAGQASYVLTPTEGMIAHVFEARFDGKRLDPIMRSNLDEEVPGWLTSQGTPHRFYSRHIGDITLVKTPISAGTLTATVAVVPGFGESEVPDWLVHSHHYTIADGAIAHLLLMVGKPWSDANLGAFYRTKFDEACGLAKQAALQEHASAPIRGASEH